MEAQGEAEADHEAFLAWCEGDREAGNRLLRRYFPAIYGFFHGRVAEHAEDLAQRTFLACLEQRGAYRSEGSFRAYLYGIARRQLLRVYERAAIHGRRAMLARTTGRSPSPSGVVMAEQERTILLRALGELPLEQQVLLELYYWDRLSTEEIACAIETSRDNVKTRLLRARKALRAAMQDDERVAV